MIPFNMSLTMLALLLLLSMNLVNGQNNDNSSVECPFRLSCSRNKNQIIEFPADPVPVKLLVTDIDCQSQQLYLSHPQNCLSSIFVTHNFSLFYPFSFASLFNRPSSVNNVTFFNCSSVGQHLRSWEQTKPGAQDMLSCPIYVADLSESVIELDLLRCTRMFDKVLPIDLSFRNNYLKLNWSEQTFHSQCLQPQIKSKHTSIIAATTGE